MFASLRGNRYVSVRSGVCNSICMGYTCPHKCQKYESVHIHNDMTPFVYMCRRISNLWACKLLPPFW
ncbi:hypothetical protein POVWA2_003690 [Plasmodium ovale wallikeri]|uniref:Uncharacterized protein n=1 Tax=Plasmodium ovale wallikeri TaxID=864142 RepID=A0A1A8YGP8_PLAOA|nr:hypothetical protein POVWA1_003540 [Plasmodium ovale wallikeri]SBT31346.1 hypothetical protein POVWA2_003690 [Plasmodium ovale wallikeri]